MLEVAHDGEPNWSPAEQCAFCEKPTRFWHVPNDVAVCPSCAMKHDACEVPNKREWLSAVRNLVQSGVKVLGRQEA